MGPKHHHQHIPQRVLLYIPPVNQSQLSKLGDRDIHTYWIGLEEIEWYTLVRRRSSRRTVGLKIFIDPRWSIRGRVEPKSWKCVRLCCCSKESSKSGVIGHAYYYIPHLFFLESLSFLLLLYSFSKFLSPLFEPLYVCICALLLGPQSILVLLMLYAYERAVKSLLGKKFRLTCHLFFREIIFTKISMKLISRKKCRKLIFFRPDSKPMVCHICYMSHFSTLNMGRVNVTYNHVNQCRMFNVRKWYDLFIIMTVVFKQIVLLSERRNHKKYILFFWPSKLKNDSTPWSNRISYI